MIEIKNVTKTFENGYEALKNISLYVNKGETLLVLGPNGAGKTTLFRCIMGIVKFSGNILIKGLDVQKHSEELKKQIGYVPQNINFPREWTLKQIINFHSKLHNLDVNNNEEKIESMGLASFIDSKISELSGGMKQRLAILLSIIHDPDIIMLDEAYANLDTLGRKLLTELLNNLKKRNKTILISTHRISETLPFADTILILNEGKKIYHDSIENFIKELDFIRFKVKVMQNEKHGLNSIDGYISMSNRWAIIETRNISKTLNELSKIQIDTLLVEEPSLDELILRLMNNEVRKNLEPHNR